jgi:hypothetical protein
MQAENHLESPSQQIIIIGAEIYAASQPPSSSPLSTDFYRTPFLRIMGVRRVCPALLSVPEWMAWPWVSLSSVI